jgi:hypothetical protein
LERAWEAGIGGPLPAEIGDSDLEALLQTDEGASPLARRPLPDFAYIHGELRRKGVTRMLFWEEYSRDHPEGYKYTQFCEYYDRWRKTLEINPSAAKIVRCYEEQTGVPLLVNTRDRSLIRCRSGRGSSTNRAGRDEVPCDMLRHPRVSSRREVWILAVVKGERAVLGQVLTKVEDIDSQADQR